MPTASTSRVPRSPSPSPGPSTEEVQPLAFDSERELLDILARLRNDLAARTKAKWEEIGGGPAEDYEIMEDVVLKVRPPCVPSESKVLMLEVRSGVLGRASTSDMRQLLHRWDPVGQTQGESRYNRRCASLCSGR
jgi:hypothetical protein